MLGKDSHAFVDDIIKSFMKEYNNIAKQMEERWFSFKRVGTLNIRRDKENEPKIDVNIELGDNQCTITHGRRIM